LIAAAPDLLTKLIECEAVLAGEGGHEGGSLLEEVRAAIAKAKVNGLAGKWEQSRTDGTTPHSTPTRNSRPQQTHNR
jgi:hypothetical protein